MSVVEPTREFMGDDGFLHAALGLLAMSEKVGELGETAAVSVDEAASGTDDDAVLYAMLGLLRLASHARALVASWAIDEVVSEEEVEDVSVSASGDMLR